MSSRYHDQMPGLIHFYLSQQNTDDNGGSEPIPVSSLINDKLTETFDIQPNKKYLIRIISMSAFAAHYVKFDGHNMCVVAIDSVQSKIKAILRSVICSTNVDCSSTSQRRYYRGLCWSAY